MMWSGRSSRPPEEPRVEFKTDCGRLFPLEELYFCDTCSKVCSRFELSEEIDSYYCPHCLENMPSSEAMLYSNRCSKCFECPVCFNTLIITQTYIETASASAALLTSRQAATAAPLGSSSSGAAASGPGGAAGAAAAASGGAAGLPEGWMAVCFFYCQYCRWASREAGLEHTRPDHLVASALGRERERGQKHEMQRLVEVFRKASQDIARERELQARMRRRSITIFYPTSYSAAASSNGQGGGGAEGLGGRPSGPWRLGDVQARQEQKEQRLKQFELRSVAKRSQKGEPVGPDATPASWLCELPADESRLLALRAARDGLDAPLADVASLEQRLRNPSDPGLLRAVEGNPARKALLTKRSRRCKTCAKIAVKPQINPCSTPAFPSKHNIALFFLPKVLLFPPEEARVGQAMSVQLLVSNPLESPLLLKVNTDPQWPASSGSAGGAGELGLLEVLTAPFETSIAPFTDFLDEGLAEDDAAAAATGLPEGHRDDPEVVRERRHNRIVVRLKVKPRHGTAGLVAKLPLALELVFRDRTTKDKEHRCTANLVVTVGKIQE